MVNAFIDGRNNWDHRAKEKFSTDGKGKKKKVNLFGGVECSFYYGLWPATELKHLKDCGLV